MARYERNSVKSYTSLAVLNAGQAVIFTLGLAAVMVMCIQGIRSGRNTIGDFVLVNALMIQLYQPLNFMGMFYREVKQAVIDIEMMFDILARPSEIVDRPDAPPLVVREGVLRFEDVHFHYDPQREILKGVTFEVPAGRTVAVVGPLGRGQIDAVAPAVPLLRAAGRAHHHRRAGHRRRDAQTSLREQIGMVPQDTVLFNDSIGYNIRYGRWSAGTEDIREAARLAQIDRFISMVPGGYEAQVGERGLKLSGGEKQRVALARTILKAPPILVLDEATSALDSFHRTRDPGRARARLAGPHDAGHRAPPVHGRQRGRDHRSRQGQDRRARHA